jgi:hypothetical protein
MRATSTANVQTFDCGGAKAFPGVGATPMVYSLAFDVYPVQVDKTTKSDLVAGVFELQDSTGSLWSVQFELTWDTGRGLLGAFLSEDSQLTDGGEIFHQTSASPLPLNAWTRVTLALTVGAQNLPQSATLSYGGAVVASGLMHPTTTNPQMSVYVGYTYVGPANAAWSMLYDNVTVYAK